MPNLGFVDRPCNAVAEDLARVLVVRGFRTSRSFDLQAARRELRAPEDCPCPAHGSTNCTCQYIVLLVSREKKAPISISLHGHDDRTYLSLPLLDEGNRTHEIERAVAEVMVEHNSRAE